MEPSVSENNGSISVEHQLWSHPIYIENDVYLWSSLPYNDYLKCNVLTNSFLFNSNFGVTNNLLSSIYPFPNFYKPTHSFAKVCMYRVLISCFRKRFTQQSLFSVTSHNISRGASRNVSFLQVESVNSILKSAIFRSLISSEIFLT